MEFVWIGYIFRYWVFLLGMPSKVIIRALSVIKALHGTKTQTPWSILVSDYEEKNEIRQPTSFKAVWHYESGDSIYFDSNNSIIEYH